MRLPLLLIVIFVFITVLQNWGPIGEVAGGELSNEEKLSIAGKLIVLTPHRIATSILESYTFWKETGDEVVVGTMALFGAGLVFLFLSAFGIIDWFIGFVRPSKSAERQSFVAFIFTLALFALAIGGPLNPTIRGMTVSVLVEMKNFIMYFVAEPVDRIPFLIVGIIIAVIVLKALGKKKKPSGRLIRVEGTTSG